MQPSGHHHTAVDSTQMMADSTNRGELRLHARKFGKWRREEGVHWRVNVKYGRWKRELKQWRLWDVRRLKLA
ncbi:hypothetical protein ES332_A01G125800v1 [Gossypium tomentosum]|uniref:Uncharacterized protein n=1 Tax=Gossypium tomentosum TaxID=34277 RepID=A0A5D2RPV5_GOSTO|nr:hypothetical protein ES332_A01G125800v1 [Gossypium tomentosum]